MKIKKIEFIPGAGVNIMVTKTRELYDEQGNPVLVEERDEPSAIGVNDFAVDPRNPTAEDRELARQKISEKLAELMQATGADLVAQNAVVSADKLLALAERDAEKAAKLQALSERDALQAEKEALQAEKEALLAEKAEKRTEKV